MGLYYSGNAVDWWPAGVLDYHLVRLQLESARTSAAACLHCTLLRLVLLRQLRAGMPAPPGLPSHHAYHRTKHLVEHCVCPHLRPLLPADPRCRLPAGLCIALHIPPHDGRWRGSAGGHARHCARCQHHSHQQMVWRPLCCIC